MKRVAIARAIIKKPCYFFFDEPTSGLDEGNIEKVIDLIHILKQKICSTSVIVTHDIDLMRSVSDRVALLREGKIILIGKKEDISENVLHQLYETGAEDV